MRSFISDGLPAELSTGTAPAAVLGIDMIHHGARRGASTEDPDNLVFNALNPRAARDNLLQGAVDLLQAMRVSEVTIPMGASPTGETISFDPAKVAYFGHSQGSQSGEIAVAFSQTARTAVFSGVGAFLTSSLLEKTSPVNIAAGMQFLFGDALDANHPVMIMFQTYFERSDTANYAPLILRAPPNGVDGHHVLMFWGKDDTYTPKGTRQQNAVSLGIPPVMPVLPDEDYGINAITRPVNRNFTDGKNGQRTAVCVQYAPPDGEDGHYVMTSIPQAVTDWSSFLDSYFATGTPTLPALP
jgi:hypothetical protein